MKNPKSFYNKLKKLIEEEVPDGCKIVYDMGKTEIFVIRKGYEFHDNDRGPSGTSWHGVLSPVNSPASDDGYDRRAIVGEGIFVDMEAVQT